MLINKIIPSHPSYFTSKVQSGIKFNTYVSLALAGSIYGDSGLVLAAILLTFIIPFINIICIITNPLILACFLEGLLNFLSFDI
ncbi:MAG: hypothetical protein HRT40_13000 [Campylobacteraceae bacterium]|nr:hypothetical protein [Campylobacteraceae bacterium]